MPTIIRYSREVFPWIALGSRLISTLDWMAAAAERSRQRRALAALDDRLLRDIGLSRGDALKEISRPFWRS